MEIALAIIAGVTGLVGVWLGAFLISRNEREQRRLAFLERRLNEFYAPMLHLRTEIKVNSDLRLLIHDAAEQGWQSVVTGYQGDAPKSDDRIFEGYSKVIEYDNEKFRKDILPAYRKMVSLFRDSMSLAYPDTAQQFPVFVEFVWIWERHMEGALPAEALLALKHTEKNCHPFYENLQRRHDELVRQIAEGKAD